MGRSIAFSSHSRNRLSICTHRPRRRTVLRRDLVGTGSYKVTSGPDRQCDGVPPDRPTDPVKGSVAQVCLSQTGRKDRRRTHPRSNTRSSLLEDVKAGLPTIELLDRTKYAPIQPTKSTLSTILPRLQFGDSGFDPSPRTVCL